GEHARCGKGHDDRLQSPVGDDQPVDQSAQRADGQAAEPRQPYSPDAFVIDDARGDTVRETYHRADGEVDPARQDDDGLPEPRGRQGHALVDDRALLPCPELRHAFDIDDEEDREDDEREHEPAVFRDEASRARQPAGPLLVLPGGGCRCRDHDRSPAMTGESGLTMPTDASTRFDVVSASPASSRTTAPSYMTSARSHRPTISGRSVEKKRMPFPAAVSSRIR